MQRRTVHFCGHVQGVGFRFMVLQMSHRFNGLHGFVRNLRDGRVELVVEAPDEPAQAFVDHINDRMAGYIESTDVHTSPATGEFRGFEIRR